MDFPFQSGSNCIIGKDVVFGAGVILGHNVIIEDNVTLGDHCVIDSNTLLRRNVTLGRNGSVGANCILGEYWKDFCEERLPDEYPLIIGDNARIRSGSILYAGSQIGDGFQTGHQATIREGSRIGRNVGVGTLSDIQGNCRIGNYVRMHSGVFVAPLSVVDDFVWLFPHVVLTNDPTPPSDHCVGVHIRPFASVAAGAVIVPGVEIGQDGLVAAGTVVTKSVEPFAVVAGNPGRVISDVRRIRSKITGEPVYPWRHHFRKYMPWAESDFLSWYGSLTEEAKEEYHLTDLIEENNP